MLKQLAQAKQNQNERPPVGQHFQKAKLRSQVISQQQAAQNDPEQSAENRLPSWSDFAHSLASLCSTRTADLERSLSLLRGSLPRLLRHLPRNKVPVGWRKRFSHFHQ